MAAAATCSYGDKMAYSKEISKTYGNIFKTLDSD